MAPLFNLISEVNPTKTQWALKVRVVRLYKVSAYGTTNKTFSLEFVYHDKEKKSGLDLPTEVESFVDRKILYKVQVKMENLDGHNDVFTIMRLTDDNNIISKYVESNVENQELGLLSKIGKNDDEGEKVSSSNDEVTILSKARINSAISDDGPESSAIKRSLCGDLSTNVAQKKLISLIKEEND
ncbi:uncharacterized protein Fot_43027 [Forsythia ovata]|uniref:Replication protein A 70 kDa DNA-binding subunit B/D first OB fold domain-containing protein n=1 Tax=Forsythia ovata TaxID=205694 RepID=A0ABD1RMV8_9LAMI